MRPMQSRSALTGGSVPPTPQPGGFGGVALACKSPTANNLAAFAGPDLPERERRRDTAATPSTSKRGAEHDRIACVDQRVNLRMSIAELLASQATKSLYPSGPR